VAVSESKTEHQERLEAIRKRRREQLLGESVAVAAELDVMRRCFEALDEIGHDAAALRRVVAYLADRYGPG
jgi:hypothetical protein